MFTRALILAFALALPAQAQEHNKLGQPVPPPGVDPGVFTLLPERKDVVSWKLLSQVELVKQKDRYVPQFSAEVAALNNKQVKMQGFMLPLQMGDKQTHFVLAAMPQTCAFCIPGGPESLVEVKSKQPVKYTFDILILAGKLEVLKDDPRGVFYVLTDAVQSQ
jgi:hypothetical protein